jgi:transcriptional regulator with XRE-family HTH domain
MSKTPAPVRNPPFGEYFKALRRALGPMTLREFCALHNLDHSNLSKMERGLLLPPAGLEKLKSMATGVGLVPGTPEWQDFLDRAFAARGEIPPDLAGEDGVIDTLPVIFRTLRGEPVSEEEVQLLLQLIRQA